MIAMRDPRATRLSSVPTAAPTTEPAITPYGCATVMGRHIANCYKADPYGRGVAEALGISGGAFNPAVAAGIFVMGAVLLVEYLDLSPG